MRFSILKLLDQDCRSVRVMQLMFGQKLLVEGNFIVGIAFRRFLRLDDDAREIIVTKQQNTEEISRGLVSRLKVNRTLGCGNCLFNERLVRIVDLRQGFGVKILQQWIVRMKLALPFEEF